MKDDGTQNIGDTFEDDGLYEQNYDESVLRDAERYMQATYGCTRDTTWNGPNPGCWFAQFKGDGKIFKVKAWWWDAGRFAEIAPTNGDHKRSPVREGRLEVVEVIERKIITLHDDLLDTMKHW